MKKLYAYCRVSTERQSLTRQYNNIVAANDGAYKGAIFVYEKYTGSTLDRPEWIKLHKKIKSGDTIVFDSVSRLSRDADEGAELYAELYSKGVTLVFLNEPYCNTDTYKAALAQAVPMTGTAVDCILRGINEYLIELAKNQIRIAFEQAQKEREDICKRVKGGMAAKKQAAAEQGEDLHYGRSKGDTVPTKKSVIAKEIILRDSKDFNGSNNDVAVMGTISIKIGNIIARNTYYKYKRELAQEIRDNA